MVQIFDGSFGAAPTTGRPSAKVRRMTKRRLKKHLERLLIDAWRSSAVTTFPPGMPARIAKFG